MPPRRTRKQIERIKKARSKVTGRYVVHHKRSVEGSDAVRSRRGVSTIRSYGRSVSGDVAITDQSGQPKPKVPLLSGGDDPTLGRRFEEELFRS